MGFIASILVTYTYSLGPMFSLIIFYLFASVLLVSALASVTLRHPVYSVLSFLASMCSLAVLFFIQQAYFIAIVQITVYAGAILVLFLFVLMLIGYDKEPRTVRRHPVRLGFSIAIAALSLAGLLWMAQTAGPLTPAALQPQTVQAGVGNVEALGRLLFRQYILPFELLSFVLLVAIIGSVVLAKKEL
ncbi:MAG: NADH-quinone oxidoreductase subunit J [Candidatus Omnitrophica bacterium]|nr:NADH-quinone oxidoreductase subunit J [Candidatus Omnitrophota bacterium]